MSLLDRADELTAEEDTKAALHRALRQLRQARTRSADLVEAVYQATKDAITAEFTQEATHKPPTDARRKAEEVALWHLTDWQGAKVTTSYNREVMRRRVHAFVDKAERITEIQRAQHPIRSATILFGGDMVEGLFNFPTQPLAEWGNHGRIGSKRDAVPRSDNVDRMCYETARQLLANETRLTWEDCPEDIQRVEIGNYRALLLHGDETGRSGFVSPKTFKEYLNRQKAGGFDWDFLDAYSGHYHSHTEDVLSGGGVWYQTGSTESDNRYARNSMGMAGQPSQRLHFIEPKEGVVTAQYKIRLR